MSSPSLVWKTIISLSPYPSLSYYYCWFSWFSRERNKTWAGSFALEYQRRNPKDNRLLKIIKIRSHHLQVLFFITFLILHVCLMCVPTFFFYCFYDYMLFVFLGSFWCSFCDHCLSLLCLCCTLLFDLMCFTLVL